MEPLNERQRQIVLFIQEFIQRHEHAPSYREIMHHFGYSSVSSVAKQLAILKRKRVLETTPGRRRSLALMPPPSLVSQTTNGELELPFIGQLYLGAALELFSKIQSITLPRLLVPAPENTYVLRIKGSGGTKEHMLEGDLLLVESRQEISSGELILYLTKKMKHSGIRSYHPEGKHIRLESRSEPGESILILPGEIVIQGVVVGLVRLYV